MFEITNQTAITYSNFPQKTVNLYFFSFGKFTH